jgi:hypothetical protein
MNTYELGPLQASNKLRPAYRIILDRAMTFVRAGLRCLVIHLVLEICFAYSISYLCRSVNQLPKKWVRQWANRNDIRLYVLHRPKGVHLDFYRIIAQGAFIWKRVVWSRKGKVQCGIGRAHWRNAARLVARWFYALLFVKTCEINTSCRYSYLQIRS